ncbi:MAG: PKD domain-containing protein, partial [Bacteroidota bacterium]
IPNSKLQKSITNLSIVRNPYKYTWSVINKTSVSSIHAVIVENNNTDNPIFIFPDTRSNTDSTYEIKLILTNKDGCTDTTSLNQTILSRPVADFKLSDTAICSGQGSITFTDISSSGYSNIISRVWNFDDGTSGSLQVITHGYNSYGTYIPKLIVRDSRGCNSDTASKKIIVYGSPVALFESPANTCLGTEIDFINLSDVGYGNKKISEIIWDFGDGYTSNLYNPSHKYKESGIYNLSLTIKSDNSCLISKINKVINIVGPPKANFSWDKTCIKESIQFQNLSKIGNGDSDYKVQNWDFGDGTEINNLFPQHIYKDPGSYFVTLKVAGKICPHLVDSHSKVISIKIPRKDSTYPRLNVVQNQPLLLSALSGGLNYLWTPTYGLKTPDRQITEAVYSKIDPRIVFYKIQIKDSSYCIINDTQEIWIFESPDVFAPTAFTPNSDNTNDIFIPFYINIKTLQSFRIYNRWGNKIFETNDMNKFWDGTFSGKPAPMETYTWLVECFDVRGRRLIKKGMVTLIRD